MSAWKTMESAPKDGETFLGARFVPDESEAYRVVYWDNIGPDHDSFPWVIDETETRHHVDFFTHWQPLGPPPLPGESNARFIAGPHKETR